MRDNGHGFGEPLEPQLGKGIRIMRHRASLLGGDLRLQPLEGGGAAVECVTGFAR